MEINGFGYILMAFVLIISLKIYFESDAYNLKCIICYNNTYNFIMSCGHAGVCDSCLIHLQKSNYLPIFS